MRINNIDINIIIIIIFFFFLFYLFILFFIIITIFIIIIIIIIFLLLLLLLFYFILFFFYLHIYKLPISVKYGIMFLRCTFLSAISPEIGSQTVTVFNSLLTIFSGPIK